MVENIKPWRPLEVTSAHGLVDVDRDIHMHLTDPTSINLINAVHWWRKADGSYYGFPTQVLDVRLDPATGNVELRWCAEEGGSEPSCQLMWAGDLAKRVS